MNDTQEFLKYLKNKYKGLTNDKLEQMKKSGLLKKDYQEFLNLKKNSLKQEEDNKEDNKSQKAAHGAKLLYFRSLKHQCADNEELYYYKKGGRVGCGCKKKEDGGEVRKAGLGCSAVDKFKSTRKMQKAGKVPENPQIWPNDTVHIQNPKTKKMEVRDLSGKHKLFKPLTKEEYQKQSKSKKNDIDIKGYKNGGNLERLHKLLNLN